MTREIERPLDGPNAGFTMTDRAGVAVDADGRQMEITVYGKHFENDDNAFKESRVPESGQLVSESWYDSFVAIADAFLEVVLPITDEQAAHRIGVHLLGGPEAEGYSWASRNRAIDSLRPFVLPMIVELRRTVQGLSFEEVEKAVGVAAEACISRIVEMWRMERERDHDNKRRGPSDEGRPSRRRPPGLPPGL